MVPLYVLPGRPEGLAPPQEEEAEMQAAKNKRYLPSYFWQHVRNQRKRSADDVEQTQEVKPYFLIFAVMIK